MRKKEYDWLGDWQGPEYGKYVIRQDDREMEPSEVIAILDDYQDLVEQLSRTDPGLNRLKRLKDGLIEEQKKHYKRSDVYVESQFLITMVNAIFELLGEDYQDRGVMRCLRSSQSESP